MSNPNPIVMLVEDCPVTGVLVERVIMHEIPECRLLWSRTMNEATLRAEGLPVDVFITDVGLPDGSGLELLWKLACTHPKSRAIVITATPLPEYEAHSAALGVLDFLEKPLNLPNFTKRLRHALDLKETSTDSRDFRATLESVTALDIVQLKCMSHANTVVEFQSEGKLGIIRFEQGEVTHSQTGTLEGQDALFEILAWTRGQISERPLMGAHKRTVHGSWQGLLMEAAQRCDEMKAAAAAA